MRDQRVRIEYQNLPLASRLSDEKLKSKEGCDDDEVKDDDDQVHERTCSVGLETQSHYPLNPYTPKAQSVPAQGG